jgi:hypothetical protein
MLPKISPRRTRRISWAPSGWLVSGTTMAVDTDLLTLTCADDFVAVRVGFTNINPNPYSITKVIASASPTLGDYANPSGDAVWTPLTFANAGAASDVVVSASGAPTSITVPGNRQDPATGRTDLPCWTWTDWTPLRSVLRTDRPDAPRAVMIRVLLPANCTHTRPNGGFLEYHRRPEMNRGFDYVAGHVPADVVTTPQPIFAPAACIGQSNPPASCVQFLTVNEGIVGMTTGDSHHQGTSTTTQFWNYLLQATVELGARHVGRVPFGYWSTARGGADSGWFFSSLSQVLPVAMPSFVVLPGWTYNEMSGSVHADQTATDLFFARLMMAAESCNRIGAVPVFLTPFPRDPGGMTPVQVGPWRKLRDSIMTLCEAGAVVLDATDLFGHRSEGILDGTYLPEYSDDHAHPNNAAHAALAGRVARVIEGLFGLPTTQHTG